MTDKKIEEAARELLERAENRLIECYRDYSHPSFTDRYGTADRIKSVLDDLRAFLAAYK